MSIFSSTPSRVAACLLFLLLASGVNAVQADADAPESGARARGSRTFCLRLRCQASESVQAAFTAEASRPGRHPADPPGFYDRHGTGKCDSRRRRRRGPCKRHSEVAGLNNAHAC